MSKHRNLKPSKTLSGIIFMMIHALSMSMVYVVSKKLTKVLNPEQVAFLYKFSVFIIVVPWCFRGGVKKNLGTKKIGIHVARSLFSAAATICFYNGLQKVQTTDAAAITYLEQILVLIIGVTYFREKLSHAQLILVSCGVIGAMLVIKPGFQQFNSSYVFIFLAIVFWAMNNLSVKILGKTEKTKTQLFYAMLFGSLFTLPFTIGSNWNVFTAQILQYIAVLAIMHLIHVISFFRAFKYADISSVMPFDYTRLIFTGFFSYLFLEELPDKISVIGYLIIAAGGLYLIFYEGSKKGWGRVD